MRHGWGIRTLAAGFVALGCAVGSVLASEVSVQTKTGEFYVGEIVEQDVNEVRIRTKIHNIVTVLTLKRRDIISIKETKLPEEWLAPAVEQEEEAAEEEAGSEAKPEKNAGGPSYLVAPMKGVIGEEVMADGLEQVIKFAKRSGVSHIVLEIDSPGGLASEGRRIGELIRESKGDVTFVAYVKSALSAAVIPAIASQRIFYEPEAQIGAAVAYRWVPQTGTTAVDEKFLSAFAATMAALAESNGLNPAIVRAMVIPREQVFVWQLPSGEQVVSGEKPPKDAKGARTVDNAQSVLTLTAREAHDLRFGEILPEKGLERLGEWMGEEQWTQFSDYGELAMRRAKNTAEEAANALDRFETVFRSISPLVMKARNESPEARVHLYYQEGTGRLSARSRKEWREQTDVAVKAWDQVLDAVSELERLDGKYKSLTREGLLDSRKDVKRFKENARDEQKRLKANRNRSTV